MNLKFLRPLAVLLAAVVMVLLFAPHAPAQDTSVILSEAMSGEFEAVNPVAIFIPDNLYEYINGQAVFYLSYRFKRLEHGHYRKGDAEYYIDVYELGSPLSAFGAFRQQREEGAEQLDAGAEGAITDYLAVLYEGSHYVEIIPMSSGTDDVANMRQIASLLDEVLPGTDDVPAEAALFPQTMLVKGSERYVDENLASYGFLGRGLSAMYQLPDQEKDSRVFISIWDDTAAAEKSLAEYQTKLGNATEMKISSAVGYRGAEPYRGTTIVMQTGKYVFGMHSVTNEAAAISVLNELVANLAE